MDLPSSIRIEIMSFLFAVSLICWLLFIPMPLHHSLSSESPQLFSSSTSCLQLCLSLISHARCSSTSSYIQLWPCSPFSASPSACRVKSNFFNTVKNNLRIMAQQTHLPRLMCLNPKRCLLFSFSVDTLPFIHIELIVSYVMNTFCFLWAFACIVLSTGNLSLTTIVRSGSPHHWHLRNHLFSLST